MKKLSLSFYFLLMFALLLGCATQPKTNNDDSARQQKNRANRAQDELSREVNKR